MKKKEKQTYIDMNDKELIRATGELRKQLATITRTRYTKPSKNVREVKNVRNKLAVALTVLREKELKHGTEQ